MFEIGDFRKTLHITDLPEIDGASWREGGYVELRGRNFIVESICFRNGLQVHGFFVDETTFLCDGEVSDLWQISNNDGIELSEAFRNKVTHIEVTGFWP